MNEITKVSEITAEDVWEYLNPSEDMSTDSVTALNTLIGIAKAYISSYTGRSQEELDNYPDFVIVVLVLCQDMWDNRTMYIEKGNLNKVIETILDMHSVNLI